MNRFLNRVFNIKLLVSIALLATCWTLPAYAALVTATMGTTANGGTNNFIFNSSGVGSTRLATGAFVQLVTSTDGTRGAPDASTGLPAGDTVVATATVGTPTGYGAGEISISRSITNGLQVYIRAWDTWTGTGTPSGNYGDSTPAAVSGFGFPYQPASFATTTSLSPTPTASPTPTPGDPTITRFEDLVNPPGPGAGVVITSAEPFQSIKIVGSGFGGSQGLSTVAVGGIAVTSFFSWSTTSIDIQIPGSISNGSQPVAVTVAGLTATQNITITGGASPTPTPTPTPTASPTPTPSASPTPTPSGSPTPTPGPSVSITQIELSRDRSVMTTSAASGTVVVLEGNNLGTVADGSGDTDLSKIQIIQGSTVLSLVDLGASETGTDHIFYWGANDAAHVVHGAQKIEMLIPADAPKGRVTIRVTTGGTSAEVPFTIPVTTATQVALNFPNPFNPDAEVTVIEFVRPAGANVRGYLFSINGRLVRVLDDTNLLPSRVYVTSGNSAYEWNGRDFNGAVVGNGVYLVHVINESTRSVLARGKVLVIR